MLEDLNVYHPFTGVTNNQSESFNSTLKRLQRCREVPVDSVVLTLYHLQAYYHNEIQRGFAGATGLIFPNEKISFTLFLCFRIRELQTPT